MRDIMLDFCQMDQDIKDFTQALEYVNQKVKSLLESGLWENEAIFGPLSRNFFNLKRVFVLATVPKGRILGEYFYILLKAYVKAS